MSVHKFKSVSPNYVALQHAKVLKLVQKTMCFQRARQGVEMFRLKNKAKLMQQVYVGFEHCHVTGNAACNYN